MILVYAVKRYSGHFAMHDMLSEKLKLTHFTPPRYTAMDTGKKLPEVHLAHSAIHIMQWGNGRGGYYYYYFLCTVYIHCT